MAKQIKIRFNKQAETVVETVGFVGEECTQASDFIEKALGTPTADEKSAEFYHDREAVSYTHLTLPTNREV